MAKRKSESNYFRELAIIGARVRLAELDEERVTLIESLQELLPAGTTVDRADPADDDRTRQADGLNPDDIDATTGGDTVKRQDMTPKSRKRMAASMRAYWRDVRAGVRTRAPRRKAMP
jgi:hypothetical protein